jgi:hypothetical protein
MDAMVLANILRTDLHLYKPMVNQLICELKNYCPVVLEVFSQVDQEITLAFLECYPTPEQSAAASMEEVEDFFQKNPPIDSSREGPGHM